MNDLISREQALKAVAWDTEAYTAINMLPSVDEVKHGRWIRVGDNSYKCSECGEVSCCFAHYCPDCGARMDGE